MKTKKFNAFSMTQIAICTSLMCVSSFITIPLPIIPITMQLFSAVLIALLLKPSHTLICMSLYLFSGSIGLPVFSGGKGGIGVLLSPTGGFIIGFVLGAFLISLLKGKTGDIKQYILVSVIFGIIPVYALGLSFFIFYTSLDLISAITKMGAVFLLIDIAKCIFASILAIILNKALKKSDIPL